MVSLGSIILRTGVKGILKKKREMRGKKKKRERK